MIEETKDSKEIIETLYSKNSSDNSMDDLPEKTMRKLIRRRKNQPIHYRTVCISLYNRDIVLLEQLLRKLRRLGHSKINKSQIIRFALSKMDIEEMPRAI